MWYCTGTEIEVLWERDPILILLGRMECVLDRVEEEKNGKKEKKRYEGVIYKKRDRDPRKNRDR